PGSSRGTGDSGGSASPRGSGCSSWSWISLSLGSDQPMTNTATREAWGLGLVAAAKEEQTEQHVSRLPLDPAGRACGGASHGTGSMKPLDTARMPGVVSRAIHGTGSI